MHKDLRSGRGVYGLYLRLHSLGLRMFGVYNGEHMRYPSLSQAPCAIADVEGCQTTIRFAESSMLWAT